MRRSETSRSLCALCFAAIACAGVLSTPAAAQESSSDLLLILDASGSMWGQIEGENKIVIARRVLKELAADLPDDAEVGLVAYGHRREGDCEDVETVMPMAALDRAALGVRIDGLNPKGKTPITTSVRHAFDEVRERDAPTTVLLVSDGIETCGGDPCAAVREAREAGIEFVMHVVGFDVAEVDASQLECAAQAGGGLYFDVQNADQLAAALDRAVEITPEEVPDGRLSVEVIADGELQDAMVQVTDENGEPAGGGRSYASPETNPRVIPLEDGRYDVEVRAVGIKGSPTYRWQIEIEDGSTVEKVADFTTGELAVGVTRNGELSDAVVRVYAAGTSEQVAGGRTYTSANSNTRVYRIAAGTYDVTVGSVEIANGAEKRFEGVVVEPGGRADLAHAYDSGTLKIGAESGGELVDATVKVAGPDGKEAYRSHTYVNPKSNPSTFTLLPGDYKVTVKAVRLEGRPQKEIEVKVEKGATAEHVVEF